ncbi:MAG: hypothetical protein LBQ56_07375 [Synergistaceae bacterium]|jgi:hypothetical protein|nr:hypothetical protein [Synergistaceae bacterium]
MKPRDTNAVLHDVLKSMASKPPTRNGRASFSSVVKMGYDDILELRGRGYSFKAILKELVEADFFTEDADPKYLCQAFAREKKRREKKRENSHKGNREATGSI